MPRDITIKALLCDVDGPLAYSKQRIPKATVAVLAEISRNVLVGLVSGASRTQMREKSSGLVAKHGRCRQLYEFSSSAGACAVYNPDSVDGWQELYRHDFGSVESVEQVMRVFCKHASKYPYLRVKDTADGLPDNMGEVRGNIQIVFSLCGQSATLSRKQTFNSAHDGDRIAIAAAMREDLPEFDVTVGGLTSIEVTPAGVNKAVAVRTVCQREEIPPSQIVYIGDALFPGGNDYPVVSTGAVSVKIDTPVEGAAFLNNILAEVSS